MPLHPQLHTSWVQFGAMRFVLDTLRMNAWLTLAPWFARDTYARMYARAWQKRRRVHDAGDRAGTAGAPE